MNSSAEWRAARVVRGVEAVLLLVATIFLALHAVHLKADFPNHSVWTTDWAKYTDEGWYGDAAIRLYQLGHWNVPGDFNAAAALPVWPAIEAVLFRVTGVSLVAVRALTVAVFGMILVCCYLLIRRWPNTGPGNLDGNGADPNQTRTQSLAAAIAVLLLAVSPFCYAFMRMAILEPMLILLTLMALLVASAAGRERTNREPLHDGSEATVPRGRLTLRSATWTVALGLLLPLMVLTKTTGVFLFPAIFWLLWASSGYRVRPFLHVALPAAGLAAAVWAGYFEWIVRPRYLVDYRYLFSANAYTGVTLKTLTTVLSDTVSDGAWIGRTVFAMALVAVAAAVASLCVRRLRGNPLPAALLLWVFGYAAFLAYHANLQPRYYLVLAPPLTMLVAIVFEALVAGAVRTWSRAGTGDGETRQVPAGAWTGTPAASWMGTRVGAWLRASGGRFVARLMGGFAGGALLFALLSGARQTLYFVRHPEYTFIGAAEQIRQAVARELAANPSHSPLVLSISGSDLSLMTGLPSICDDFGTMELDQRVAVYHPGWFATWNYVENDKMESLEPMYRLVRVAAIPALDDRERNLLILYRLDPATPSSPPAPRPRRRRYLSVPNPLRTKLGEQPSVSQLKH